MRFFRQKTIRSLFIFPVEHDIMDNGGRESERIYRDRLFGKFRNRRRAVVVGFFSCKAENQRMENGFGKRFRRVVRGLLSVVFFALGDFLPFEIFRRRADRLYLFLRKRLGQVRDHAVGVLRGKLLLRGRGVCGE